MVLTPKEDKRGQTEHSLAKTYYFLHKLSQTYPKWKVGFWAAVCLPSKTYFMKTIKVKEFEVPVDIIGEVADLIASNDLENSITGTDEHQEIIFLEVSYDKDEEDQKAAIHEIEDAINDYDDEDDDDEKEGD